MAWSLLKILGFIALVSLLAFGLHLANHFGDGLLIQIGDTEYTPKPAFLVAISLIAFALLWLGSAMLRFLFAVLRVIMGQDSNLKRYFIRQREKRGLDSLTDALIALAAGEGTLAIQKAERAEKLLGRPEFSQIITAQAADISGDTARVDQALKGLLSRKHTRFLGVRGLLRRRLAENDLPTALVLAAKALKLNPKNAELAELYLRMQMKTHDWDGARLTLAHTLKMRHLTRDLWRRRDGIIATAKALHLKTGKEAEAAASEAVQKIPDFPLAAAIAAQKITAKNPRMAKRFLIRAWKQAPHPDIAKVFRSLAPKASPQERLTQFQPLFETHPENTDVHILHAQLLLEADKITAARTVLLPVCQALKPSAPALRLMAEIERRSGGGEPAIRNWLERALCAPSGPSWICDKCHSLQTTWQPLCPVCEAIDSFSWRVPKTETDKKTEAFLIEEKPN